MRLEWPRFLQGKPPQKEFLPESIKNLNSDRRIAKEAEVRVRLLQDVKQAREDLGRQGESPQLLVGSITGNLVLLSYVMRSDPANTVWQSVPFGEKIVGVVLAAVLIPIALFFGVVLIVLYSYVVGVIISPILLFLYELITSLLLRAREWFIPLGHSDPADLEYFIEHFSWPATPKEEREQNKSPVRSDW